MTRSAIAAAMAVALGACAAMAQVRPVSNGRALDANYRVGSGGINDETPGQNLPNGQLYISGQVTGLAKFGGRVGYYDTSQIHSNLPSSNLSRFGAESVGVKDVLSGPTYLTAPYYAPNQTVLTVQDIQAGKTLYTLSPPRTRQDLSGLAGRYYIDADKDFQEIDASGSRRRTPAGDVGGRQGLATDLLGPGETEEPFLRFDTTTPFGLSTQSDMARLAGEMYKDRINFGALQLAVKAAPGQPDRQTDVFRSDSGEKSPSPLTGLRPFEEPSGSAAGAGSAKKTIHRPVVASGRPRANQDAFFDLLARLRDTRSGPTEPTVGAHGKPIAPGAAELTGRSALVELSAGNEVIIHSLAGAGEDQFNLAMGRAESSLKAGRFYSAAADYERAAATDPTNPLAQIGLATACFGAGEYYRAAENLREAFAIFPPLMEARLDIKSIMNPRALLAAMDGLTLRLADRSRPAGDSVVMLGVFLNRGLNYDQNAAYLAARLKDSPTADQTMRTFANLVLTGKSASKPATQTTQPAGDAK
ncbi:MAG: hypothetical protein HZA50_18285 [Planctomycetes bacterium]|nr:hypothetical protein [Planctomycetota bacterium]